MKRIIIFLAVAITVLFIACEENGLQSQATDRMSSLSKPPFTNPFDSLGILHNIAMDAILGELEKVSFDSTNFLTQAEMLTKDYYEGVGWKSSQADSGWTLAMEIVDYQMLFPDANLGYKSALDSIVENAGFTSKQLPYMRRIVNLAQDEVTGAALSDSLYNIEYNAYSFLPDSLHTYILYASSGLRHSSAYWHDIDNQKRWADLVSDNGGPNNICINWGVVGATDVGGIVTGATYGAAVGTGAFGPPGTVGGAIGGAAVVGGSTSLGAAVTMWIIEWML